MKQRGMIFNTGMVRAILEGRKTETRRPVKLQPPNDGCKMATITDTTGRPDQIGRHFWFDPKIGIEANIPTFNSPFGEIGDIIYVRETCLMWTSDGEDIVYATDNNYSHCHADMKKLKAMGFPKDGVGNWKVIPSIHMPRSAARIFLLIEDVRVERIQDITEEDAIAEGVGHGFRMNAGWPDYLHVKNGVCTLTQDSAAVSFGTLWQSLYGPESWERNPWVWVYKFRRIER